MPAEIVITPLNEIHELKKAIRIHCQDCAILFSYQNHHDGEEKCDEMTCPLYRFCPFKTT